MYEHLQECKVYCTPQRGPKGFIEGSPSSSIIKITKLLLRIITHTTTLTFATSYSMSYVNVKLKTYDAFNCTILIKCL